MGMPIDTNPQPELLAGATIALAALGLSSPQKRRKVRIVEAAWRKYLAQKCTTISTDNHAHPFRTHRTC
jgi:hypothetical protein